jgi:hypothetical protein
MISVKLISVALNLIPHSGLVSVLKETTTMNRRFTITEDTGTPDKARGSVVRL